MTNNVIHRDILDRIGYPRILVIGDLILDRYTFGNAERVSPEAPVVVLRVDEKDVRLGGAASVAMLLRGLEAEVTLAGVIGDDHEGRTLLSLLRDENVDCHMVLVDPSRPTTTKERIIGRAANRHSHQIVRVDHEAREPISSAVEGTLLAELDRLLWGKVTDLPEPVADAASVADRSPFSCRPSPLSRSDAVLIADYAKGVCTPTLLRRVIDGARGCHIPVLVDPARITDYSRYAGATLLKPNRAEAELATDLAIQTPHQAFVAGEQLSYQHNIDSVLITLDRDGLIVASKLRVPFSALGECGLRSDSLHIPTSPREIYDITGAGDAVLATLGLCVAAEIPLLQAAQIANVAAGLQVERLGVAPVTRAELSRAIRNLPIPLGEGRGERGINSASLNEQMPPGLDPTNITLAIPHSELHGAPASGAIRARKSSSKIISLSQAVSLAAAYRAQGKTLVFTNGCFDLLHVGHIACLEQAAEHGDILLVAINSDASVRRLKGPDRPVIAAIDRARMLASLACVAHILIFDEPTPHRILEEIRPEVLAKGGTTAEIVGREVVEAYGGHVTCVGKIDGVSTTHIISRAHVVFPPANLAGEEISRDPQPSSELSQISDGK